MNSQITYMDFEKIYISDRLDYKFLLSSVNIESKYTIYKIKDLCLKSQIGKTIKGLKYKYSGDIPFIKVDNFINDNVVLTDKTTYITKDEFNDYYKSGYSHKGDVLISIVATIGAIAKNDYGDCVTNQQIVSFTLNEAIVDRDYFVQVIKSEFIQNRLDGLKKISATPNMNTNDILNFELPIPTLTEQQRTLPFIKAKIKGLENKIKELEEEKEKNSLQNVIDRVFEKELEIERPKYIINNYNKLMGIDSCVYYKDINDLTNELDFTLNTSFNIKKELILKYKCIRLEELLEIPLCMGASTKKIDEETEFYRIMVKNLSSNDEKMKIEDIDNISYEDYSTANERNILKENDILFSASGAGCLGNIVINSTNLKAIIDSHVGILRLKDNSKAWFIYYFLNSYIGLQQIFRCITGTTGQISLNMTKMKKISIPLLNDEIISKIIKDIAIYKNHKKDIDNKIKLVQEIIDKDLNKYILQGYSEDLFKLPQEV